MTVKFHPNYGTACVKVDGHPYHWDGGLCRYRPGYGPYSTTSAIGEWETASTKEAKRVIRELRNAA